MERNIQIKIGDNGEVVELPLKEYERLLEVEKNLIILTRAIMKITINNAIL